MQSVLLRFRSSAIHFTRMGSGSQPVVCFHGYGEEVDAFSFLEKNSSGEFTFYAIDLPFHGKTEWNEGLIFTQQDLQQITDQVVNDPNQKIILLGFSLGCRVALSLYQAGPEKVEKLVLLAPDGLKMNFWYWLATQTWAGNQFFALTMKKPGWFLGFLKLLNKLGLVNTSIFKFVNYYISDNEVRRLLYARWTTLRKLKPSIRNIRKNIHANKTPARLIYGKHDRIILSSVGEKFRKDIEGHCTITVINSGHQVLQEKYAGEIVNALLH